MYMGDMRSLCRVLVDKPEENKSLLRTRHKWQSGT
jgi:hypothetical protein